MKIIGRNNAGNNFMFDTHSGSVCIITTPHDSILSFSHDSSCEIRGEKSKVQAMFDAIVAAEKHGDKFFEINDGIIEDGWVEDNG
jgi:hypothetical protein